MIIFLRIRILHLSDGVLAPVGLVLKIFFPWLKVAVNIHGLDLTFVENFPLYHFTNILAIRKLDRIIAVSEATKEACIKYGVKEEKITVIHNGMHTKSLYLPKLRASVKMRQKLWNKFLPQHAGKIDFEKQQVILSFGRLMKHKGMSWFLENVVENLDPRAVLVIGGGGPDAALLEKIVKEKKLEERVFLLGAVSDAVRKYLFNAANIMVMPNIEIPGFREGFGIVALEGCSCGLAVVVSDLQGLKDAVQNKKNGVRITSRDSKKFIEVINYILAHPKYQELMGKRARAYVREHFDWKVVAKNYLKVFQEME